MQNENQQYFLDNHAQLVKEHNGKFIVIFDQQVIGEYDRGLEAYKETRNLVEPGEYLIRLCKVGNGASD
ncbi:MAG: hypothetical protein IPI60_17915 [Saprospiraceae bacterium]|nr:hypothetical protein [Saprospiraceae bacterium]